MFQNVGICGVESLPPPSTRGLAFDLRRFRARLGVEAGLRLAALYGTVLAPDSLRPFAIFLRMLAGLRACGLDRIYMLAAFREPAVSQRAED